jgi:hypothetical protein
MEFFLIIDYIQMVLYEADGVWSGLIWLRIGTGGWLLRMRERNVAFQKNVQNFLTS